MHIVPPLMATPHVRQLTVPTASHQLSFPCFSSPLCMQVIIKEVALLDIGSMLTYMAQASQAASRGLAPLQAGGVLVGPDAHRDALSVSGKAAAHREGAGCCGGRAAHNAGAGAVMT